MNEEEWGGLDDPNYDPEIERPDITVSELDELTEKIFEKRLEIDKLKEIKTKLELELTQLKVSAVAYLKETGKDKFAGPRCTISKKEKWSVKMPQDLEDKKLFFDYLKGKDLFDQYATVNYQALNSYFKEEYAAAERDGPIALMEFSLPGIGAPTVYEDITIRKS